MYTSTNISFLLSSAPPIGFRTIFQSRTIYAYIQNFIDISDL